jgi:hypothetical protein
MPSPWCRAPRPAPAPTIPFPRAATAVIGRNEIDRRDRRSSDHAGSKNFLVENNNLSFWTLEGPFAARDPEIEDLVEESQTPDAAGWML